MSDDAAKKIADAIWWSGLWIYLGLIGPTLLKVWGLTT